MPGSDLKDPIRCRPDDPCLCGSLRRLDQCCLHEDGSIHKKLGSLLPPEPKTEFSHPKCYLNVSNDCSTKISREHYISKSVLLEIDSTFKMPLFSSEEINQRLAGVESMVSKILCERHNNNLSELDSTARDFFLYSRRCYEHVSSKSLSRKRLVLLASGDAFELWCIKTLFGLYHSKMATEKAVALKGSTTANAHALLAALENRSFATPLGMYVLPQIGEFEGELAFAPLTLDDRSRTIGAYVRLMGLTVHCIFDLPGTNFLYLADNYFYRPSAINFLGPKRSATILLTWKDGTKNESVNIRVEKYKSAKRNDPKSQPRVV